MAASTTRRNILMGSAASALGLTLPLSALAKPENALNQLIGKLPAELRAILPAQLFQAGEFVSALLALESEAAKLRLPKSALSLTETYIPTDLNQLYEKALPRLVALIDRAEAINLPFAEKSAALLAQLHGTQHVTPFALNSGAAFNFGPVGGDMAPIDLPKISVPQIEMPDIELLPPVLTEPEQAEPLQQVVPAAIRRSLRFGELEAEYTSMFASLKLNPSHSESAQWHLSMMRQSKPRYASAAKRSGVPWYFIAATHGLEASFNFRAHFHNGDFPLSQRTRQVPAGRPLVWLPPSDWESSTVDALRLMGFAGASDWSLARTLYRLEAYNGFGYRRIGRATPYLWSFSNHYARGKFVADGRFNPNARSQQCGAAVMLKLLADGGEIELG